VEADQQVAAGAGRLTQGRLAEGVPAPARLAAEFLAPVRPAEHDDTMTSTLPRPPYDPEIAAVLAPLGEPTPSLTTETLDEFRASRNDTADDLVDAAAAIGAEIVHSTYPIPGYQGAEIELTVIMRSGHDRATPAPGFLFLHGGGMVMANRFSNAVSMLPAMLDHDGVLVTVEYRLAPEHLDPIPVEDCYAALVWTADHAAELGIDPNRIIVTGPSAGAGLAAGVALLARDRRGPALLGQLLVCPMLDDRIDTVSSRQYVGIGIWDRTSNISGWTALLGDRRGTDEVSIYAAPARATDLSGLPPAFIEVGSAEVFRDEDVAYATRIWADGGVAELHVWPGGTHGFSVLAPESRLARAAVATRADWIAALLGRAG